MSKICFVNINIYSLFSPHSEALIGGAEVQLFNLSNYLKNKHEVSIITGDWGQKNAYEKFDNINVWKSFSLDKKLKNYIKAPFLLWQKMKSINADIYIISSAGIEVGLVGFFCKLLHKKFIYRTAHEIDCSGEYIKKNGWKGIVYKYGLLNADMVVTQGLAHKKMLAKNHNIKATVIKNSFQISHHQTKHIKKFILWVARCSEWKHPELFLDIVSKFPEEKFVMISPISGEQKKLFYQIKKMARQLGNLKFIKGVDFSDSQKYYNKAKLFIGTSEFEGFPNTYIQACIGGTPIISYVVNPDKFITNNNLGYCADGDFNRMLKQIKIIIKDSDDWSRKSSNAIQYVKKNHNILINAEKWNSIINNFLK